MATLATQAPSLNRLFPLSSQQLASLVRTCERAPHPAWLTDLSDRCVYQNRSAIDQEPTDHNVSIFELEDHHGRTIGHLHVADA